MARKYLVPEGNLEPLRRRLARLSGRAEALGLNPMTLRVIGEHAHDTLTAAGEDRPGMRQRSRVFEVEVEGAAPTFGDWRFIAVVLRDTNGAPVTETAMPGETVPPDTVRHDAGCDHCNVRRQRLLTYLVSRPDGSDLKQVGSTCVQDFLGHASADWVVGGLDSYRKAFGEIDAAQSADWRYGKKIPPKVETVFFVATCNRIIQQFGWLSAKEARQAGGIPTWSRVRDALDAIRRDPDAADLDGLHPRVDDHLTAVEAIEWARSLGDSRSPFLRELSRAASCEFVEEQSFGILPALLPSRERSLQDEKRKREYEAAAATSRHVGEVGKRLHMTVTVEARIPIPDKGYGPSILFRMIDGDGNVLTWLTGSHPNLKKGCDYEIKGTVKQHRVRKGGDGAEEVEVSETALTRVSVLAELKATERAGDSLTQEDVAALDGFNLAPS